MLSWRKTKYNHLGTHLNGQTESDYQKKLSRNVQCRWKKNSPKLLYIGGNYQPSKCWYVTCWFGNGPVEALIDSGAEASLMSSRIFKTLEPSVYSCFMPDCATFWGISGQQQSQGLADFTFSIGSQELEVGTYTCSGVRPSWFDFGNGHAIVSYSKSTALQVYTYLWKWRSTVVSNRTTWYFTSSRYSFSSCESPDCSIYIDSTGGPQWLVDRFEGRYGGSTRSIFDRTQLIVGTSVVAKNKHTLPTYVINLTETWVQSLGIAWSPKKNSQSGQTIVVCSGYWISKMLMEF